MNREEPIYETPKETYLAQDRIIPYGGRVSASSESWLEEVTIRLLGGRSKDEKESTNE